ncbi:type I-E CRISPR-associated protein Cse1/CasA [Halomonas sp. PAMB 3232]|uniref:type I-E CRISPR-associated protein Cse1/CasA n=1 Tax=Halomonas sp. PAMB 3232 TaxID=3075221 RepID=UPI00289BD0F7|nr:type I-E CRISPR-associated protein Cse1/CasA [Halomonas sp. PAMB 3232]WNL38604.1 type I-E CRISPR-associated protein Cse1/CasA [Halomonas sp. PAMB 3232]
MSANYSLLDEPWLPVRLANGQVMSLGLLDVFKRSAEIVALAETSPPGLIAQYRLLLAITHRALTQKVGKWRSKDRAGWYREGLPLDAVCGYLESLRERFYLFHPSSPFMQVAALDNAEATRDKVKPWTQISLASANGNTPVVFDHTYDIAPGTITPAEAINSLLGFLQFTPGGLVKTLRGSDKAGALANTAAIIPMGANLTQTIALCLHPFSQAEASTDLPAWEREPLTIEQLSGNPVHASGPNDRYTRQSRAVLLLREEDGSVSWLRFAAGYALADDDNAPDPMASFRSGSNGPVRISFYEGRAMWRDLPAILPGPRRENETSRPAAVISFAAALHDIDSVDPVFQPVLVAGMASDQAKLLRWRLEQFRLPANLLVDPENAQYLQTLVADAEKLFVDLRFLATRLLTQTLPDPASGDTRKRAQALVAAGPLAATYFSCAERALPEVLSRLGQDDFDGADQQWRKELRQGALDAWRRVIVGLGTTPRALRAEAQLYPRLLALLKQMAPSNENNAAQESSQHGEP